MHFPLCFWSSGIGGSPVSNANPGETGAPDAPPSPEGIRVGRGGEPPPGSRRKWGRSVRQCGGWGLCNGWFGSPLKKDATEIHKPEPEAGGRGLVNDNEKKKYSIS